MCGGSSPLDRTVTKENTGTRVFLAFYFCLNDPSENLRGPARSSVHRRGTNTQQHRALRARQILCQNLVAQTTRCSESVGVQERSAMGPRGRSVVQESILSAAARSTVPRQCATRGCRLWPCFRVLQRISGG